MSIRDFNPRLPTPETVFPAMVGRLGYPPSAALNPDIRQGIELAIRKGLDLVRVRTVSRKTPLLDWRGGVLRGDGIRVSSAKWAALMDRAEGPEWMCAFLLTLGEEVDAQISRMQPGSIFEAYLLDAVGSELAERMAEQLESHLADGFAAQGCQITARFSPGYCDWSLQEGQEELFRFLAPERVGVRCTPAGMMIPRKSVSGVLVAARHVTDRVPCPYCAKRECPYRRDGRKSSSSRACSKKPRCKAREVPRNEAYIPVRRSDEG
ncbi:MAG: vitamin B12 dependent-methionine synthase activation domain-containing protein [bacterium]